MIFNKPYLAEEFNKKIDKIYSEEYPFKTIFEEAGDVVPMKLIFRNYYTAFDLKSNEMKDLVYGARKEIIETCFNEDDMGVVPNGNKINECIKRVNYKHYGKQLDLRNALFGNSKFILN